MYNEDDSELLLDKLKDMYYHRKRDVKSMLNFFEQSDPYRKKLSREERLMLSNDRDP